ncbi:MAG: putative DNA-binding protein [Bacteroidetes bacterium]|nr:putative DNA-binding protein [Bacteroidota bacterium]
MKDEIIIYHDNQASIYIEVLLQDETVWLNRNQIAQLFGKDVKTIGKHINNVFNEGELVKQVVVANFATTTKHGAIEGKTQTILTEHYNLDVIISVGYRVKSKQATQFRIWATNILRDYLLKGYALNQRMDRIENNYENLNNEVQQIALQLKTRNLTNQGIFFNGQIFDAYVFVSEIFKNAKSEIILIDNYIDESVLLHLY